MMLGGTNKKKLRITQDQRDICKISHDTNPNTTPGLGPTTG